MFKFKAYLTQYQYAGCDYTIGCGHLLIDIEAWNIDDAIEKVTAIVKENYNNEETQLSKVEIFKIDETQSAVINDINKSIKEAEELEKRREKFNAQAKVEAEIERREYSEYLRLADKFGEMKTINEYGEKISTFKRSI